MGGLELELYSDKIYPLMVEYRSVSVSMRGATSASNTSYPISEGFDTSPIR